MQQCCTFNQGTCNTELDQFYTDSYMYYKQVDT